jgi:hypothetical protein
METLGLKFVAVSALNMVGFWVSQAKSPLICASRGAVFTDIWYLLILTVNS